MSEAKWYVVHTYSGYENKVKANIEKTVENRSMQDQILDVVVPVQDDIEEKNGKKKVVSRKVFPGYVLIHMDMNDDTWYVVRNTRGVTSFVGPGSKPVPLTDEEVMSMGIVKEPDIDIKVGDVVKINDGGAFADSVGVVSEVNPHKRTIVVKVSMFGREIPTEVGIGQIELM